MVSRIKKCVRIIVLLFCANIVISTLSSCTPTNTFHDGAEDLTMEENGTKLRDERLYKVWYNNWRYQYVVYSETGEILKSDTLRDEPHISVDTNGIVSIVWQCGTGPSTRLGVFCSTKDAQCSETFKYVLGYADGLVAVGNADQKVIVRSTLDNSFYREYTYEVFENAAKDIPDLYMDVSFNPNNTATVTYISTSHTLLKKVISLYDN